ncbi:MAG TPA: Asp23/Gls24 family envelope stress response protein [Dehalococcoidia bacterium]
MTRRQEDGRTSRGGPQEVPAPAAETPAGPAPEPLIQDRGKTVIGAGIVATVAAIAVRETEGVRRILPASATRSFLDRLVSPSKPEEVQGSDVSVSMQGNEVTIGVRIVVEYGRSLPAVADAVRKSVIRNVESLTGKAVKAVDVEIADLAFRADAGEPAEEAS